MAEAVWGPGGRLFSLTARQAVVLDKLRAGRLPKQIAQDLDISYETVRKHTAALRLRLGKKNGGDAGREFAIV